MAHARRKFEHAKDNDLNRAQRALLMFQQLYDIERAAREDELSYDHLKQLRQKESLPVLNELENWLKDNFLPFFVFLVGYRHSSWLLWVSLKLKQINKILKGLHRLD